MNSIEKQLLKRIEEIERLLDIKDETNGGNKQVSQKQPKLPIDKNLNFPDKKKEVKSIPILPHSKQITTVKNPTFPQMIPQVMYPNCQLMNTTTSFYSVQTIPQHVHPPTDLFTVYAVPPHLQKKSQYVHPPTDSFSVVQIEHAPIVPIENKLPLDFIASKYDKINEESLKYECQSYREIFIPSIPPFYMPVDTYKELFPSETMFNGNRAIKRTLENVEVFNVESESKLEWGDLDTKCRELFVIKGGVTDWECLKDGKIYPSNKEFRKVIKCTQLELKTIEDELHGYITMRRSQLVKELCEKETSENLCLDPSILLWILREVDICFDVTIYDGAADRQARVVSSIDSGAVEEFIKNQLWIYYDKEIFETRTKKLEMDYKDCKMVQILNLSNPGNKKDGWDSRFCEVVQIPRAGYCWFERTCEMTGILIRDFDTLRTELEVVSDGMAACWLRDNGEPYQGTICLREEDLPKKMEEDNIIDLDKDDEN